MGKEIKNLNQQSLETLCKAIKSVADIGEIIDDENVATNKTYSSLKIEERFDELFQSVSNGKDLIASAITDKGVDTLATDTFAQMANNISNISGEELKPYHVLINGYTMSSGGLYEGGYSMDDVTITSVSTTQVKIDFPRNVTKFSYIAHCTGNCYWTVNGVRLTGTEFNPVYFGGVIDIDETTTVTINLSQVSNDNTLSGYFM